MTEEMDFIRIGDMIRDNDPRTEVTPGKPRKLRVTDISLDHAWACAAGSARKIRVSLRRIHLDSKPRRTGFTRIRP